MNAHAAPDAYGRLTEPATLTIQRVLPGPAERVWAYLTDSTLRGQWLASGVFGDGVGSAFTLTWRNNELSDPPGQAPEGFGDVHTMDGEITAFEPGRRLAFTWGSTGGVTFELEPSGADVILTVIHRRIEDSELRLKIAAGWHSHLDVLSERIVGRTPSDFWGNWQRLRDEYRQRLSA